MPYEFNPFTEEFDFYLYEPTEYKATYYDHFESLPDMPTARSNLAVGVNGDGDIFAYGGYKQNDVFEIYDDSSGTWSTGTTPPRGSYGCKGVVDSNGYFHVIGGRDQSTNVWLSDHYIWTGTTWTSSGSLSSNRKGHACVIDDEDNIYVIYGEQSDGTFPSTIEKWDPSTSAFSTLTSGGSHVRRYFAAAFDSVRNVIIILLGEDSSSTKLGYAEEYDLSAGTWSDISSTPSRKRSACDGIWVNNVFVVFSGQDLHDAKDKWIPGTGYATENDFGDLPVYAWYGAASFNRYFGYLIGGYDGNERGWVKRAAATCKQIKEKC